MRPENSSAACIGHEDEYQGGWSTFWLTNPYSLPLFGQPKTKDLIDVFGQVNGSTTAYRFWPGKIHLKKIDNHFNRTRQS